MQLGTIVSASLKLSCPGCDVPVNVGVQVVGPTIVGRSVTILGEAGFNASRQWASDCDLLVHPATSQV